MLQYIVALDWCAAQSTDPPASLFDEPGIRCNILQIAPLNKQTKKKKKNLEIHIGTNKLNVIMFQKKLSSKT